jgi:hypothetical protein
VFGRLPEDDPRMQEIRWRRARPEPRPSLTQRNPETWAREVLSEMRAEAQEGSSHDRGQDLLQRLLRDQSRGIRKLREMLAREQQPKRSDS